MDGFFVYMFQTDKAWGLQKVGIVSENRIHLKGAIHKRCRNISGGEGGLK